MTNNREFLTVRPYLLEFGAAMVAYVIFLIASIEVLGRLPQGSPWRVPVALLPVLPAVGVLIAVVRHVRRIDELQRRTPLEALSISFAGTALITFSYGFLENVGFPHLSWFTVWPIMAILWLAASALTARRYR